MWTSCLLTATFGFSNILSVRTPADLLTPLQVAEVFAVHVNTVHRWKKEGRLKPAIERDTGRCFFSPEAVEALRKSWEVQ